LQRGVLTHTRVVVRKVETKLKDYVESWSDKLIFDVSGEARQKADSRTFRYEFCYNLIFINKL